MAYKAYLKQMTYLICDNLDDFIYERRFFYTVTEGEFNKDDVVVLYNHHYEHKFKIVNIIYFKDKTVLGLNVVHKN